LTTNPFLAHQLAKERMNQTLREAKNDRLTLLARDARLADQSSTRGILTKLRNLVFPRSKFNHKKGQCTCSECAALTVPPSGKAMAQPLAIRDRT
jgi:hypothetical protein